MGLGFRIVDVSVGDGVDVGDASVPAGSGVEDRVGVSVSVAVADVAVDESVGARVGVVVAVRGAVGVAV